MKTFRILSLDGGGMRALYSISVLQTLIQHFNSSSRTKDLGKQFDLIVGTSSGSLISAGLAYGKSLEQIENLYKAWGPLIFSHPAPDKKRSLLRWAALKTFWSAANRNKELKESLQKAFQEETLGELFKRRNIGLCINAVEMTSHDPKVFKTPHNSYFKDQNQKLKDVCLASSAAPILFPLARIPNPTSPEQFNTYCDGGVWAGNPVLVALIEGLHTASQDQDIEIISIGTGPSPYEKSFTHESANRGILDWGFGSRISELSVDLQGKGSTFIAQLLTQHLSTKERIVKVIRVEESWPDPKKIEHLGIDVSTEMAFSTWQNLGEQDGHEAYKKILQGNSDLLPIKEIFSNIEDC